MIFSALKRQSPQSASRQQVSFPFEEKQTRELGLIPRPVAEVDFLTADGSWRNVTMVVDTGADLTLLPSYIAVLLGIEIEQLPKLKSYGVASQHQLYLKRDMEVKVGPFRRTIPVGFVRSSTFPPLLGRHQFLETFVTTLVRDERVRFEERQDRTRV